jgi:hypothetical protein
MTKRTDELKREVEIKRLYQIYTIDDLKKAVLVVTKNKNLTKKIVDFLKYQKLGG